MTSSLCHPERSRGTPVSTIFASPPRERPALVFERRVRAARIPVHCLPSPVCLLPSLCHPERSLRSRRACPEYSRGQLAFQFTAFPHLSVCFHFCVILSGVCAVEEPALSIPEGTPASALAHTFSSIRAPSGALLSLCHPERSLRSRRIGACPEYSRRAKRCSLPRASGTSPSGRGY